MALSLEARMPAPATCPTAPPKPIFPPLFVLSSQTLSIKAEPQCAQRMGIESGDEQKLEHRPLRDRGSDKNQGQRQKEGTPYKWHKNGLCVELSLLELRK